MTNKSKLDRLLEAARGMVGDKHRAVTMRRCLGLERPEIAGLIEAACPPALLPLLEEVVERAITDEKGRIERAEAGGKRATCPLASSSG